MKVSIIVPIYNSEKYLRRCIDSILCQVWSDLELVLINDGSTDSSGEICDEFAKIDSRVNVIHQENKGVSAARNAGLNSISGQWFCFVDSDDELQQTYLSDFVEALSAYPHADLVIHGIRILDSATESEKKVLPKGSLRLFDLDVPNDLLMDIPILCIASPISKLFNIDILRKNNISFDERVSIGEDYLFVIDYMRSANKIVSDSKASYNYFRRETGSLSTTYNTFEEEVLAERLLFERTISAFSKMGMTENEIFSFYLVEFKKHAYRILFSLFKNRKIAYSRKERIRLVNTLSKHELGRIQSMFRRNGWKGTLLALTFRKEFYAFSDYFICKIVKNRL